jgi:TetR/AcrR family transcriptional regulator, transcriptional repressor for nem operon
MARLKAFDEAEIVEKAKVLFQTKGYEATSMQDLIDTLGISRSSLYDTFGDKQQLYLKALVNYCETNAKATIEHAAKTTDPFGFIYQIFDELILSIQKDRTKKGCYVVNAICELGRTNPEICAITDANNKAFEKMLQQLIFKSQQSGKICKSKNPEVLAKFLFNTICGLRINSKSYSSIKDLRAISDTALSTLTN